ncbi:MAG: hypothetical protein R2834_09010 [Rhodothermales bacterium]
MGAAAGAAGGAAASAAIANAIKASGVLVRVEPEEFMRLLRRAENPLIVYHEGGVFATKHQYLMSYKGFAFYVKTKEPLFIPATAEVVVANSIWIPG